MTTARYYDPVRAFLLRPAVAWTLVGINVVAGVGGGIYWYGPELLHVPWWALVFVPDCPLFSFLFAVALAGYMLGRRWTWYNAVVAAGCIKYGIWTITVWVIFWNAGYPATLESVIMTVTHVGLLLEGVVLMTLLANLRWRHVVIVGAWFFLSDFVDYALGFRPRMAPGVSERFMMWEMLIVSGLLTVLVGWLVERTQGRRAEGT